VDVRCTRGCHVGIFYVATSTLLEVLDTLFSRIASGSADHWSGQRASSFSHFSFLSQRTHGPRSFLVIQNVRGPRHSGSRVTTMTFTGLALGGFSMGTAGPTGVDVSVDDMIKQVRLSAGNLDLPPPEKPF